MSFYSNQTFWRCVIRPSWNEYFLGIAEAVSKRGDCTRRQVGAVIVKNNRIVATGYNGTIPGQPGCLDGQCPGGDGVIPCITIHAEANAILYADRNDCEGADIYISDVPCQHCQKLISGAGIKQWFCA
jgi:dCMP deaminase